MPQLPLQDARWHDLMSRNGKAGFVPKYLAHLLDHPDDFDAFDELWPQLCSEDTAWSAAFAAAPYVVEIARKLSPAQRFKHVYLVGYIAQCEGSANEGPCHLEPYLVASYHQALKECLPLLAEALVCSHGLDDTHYLLSSAAALKGHRGLARAMDILDCGCPHCGKEIFNLT